jgi:hypothetical protein
MEANRNRPKTNLDQHLSHNCVVCEMVAWHLPDERLALVELDGNGAVKVSGRALPVRALVCQGCGAIRMIDEWIAETHLLSS